MRKCIVALLALSSVGAAQRIPLLHRDPVDAERTALREKLTRLAETRQSLGMPGVQTSSSPELDALSATAEAKRAVNPAPHQRAKSPVSTTDTTWPPPPQTGVARQEPSLGDVARQYRQQKRQSRSSKE